MKESKWNCGFKGAEGKREKSLKTERTKASVVMQKNIKESDSQDNIEVTSNIEEILHYQEVDSISRFRSWQIWERKKEKSTIFRKCWKNSRELTTFSRSTIRRECNNISEISINKEMERKEMAGNKIIRKTKQKKFKQARKYIICKQIS